MSSFPVTRLRRLRRTAPPRSLARETRLDLADLVYPLFACPGEGVEEPLAGLPGIARRSVDRLCDEAGGAGQRGGPAGRLSRSPGALGERVRELVLMTAVCLCEYTPHGHCGLVQGGEVLNDVTLELLAKTAVSHAGA